MSIEELTPEEREFAEKNYGLLIHFMRANAVEDEHFGALSVRYLTTVKKYLSNESLQKHSFSTILWLNLKSELHSIFRYIGKHNHVVLNGDIQRIDTGSSYSAEKDDLLRAFRSLSNRQQELFRLWCCGYSYSEIAKCCQISEKAVERRISRIRRRFQKSFVKS